MSAVRHSSCKPRALLAATLMATSLLGGCSQTTGTLFSGDLFAIKKADRIIAQPGTGSPTAIAETKQPAIDEIKTASPQPAPVITGEENSAWCDYLRNDAAANAEITASPTLTASTDDEGNGSFSIGMNLLDLKKAELIRQSGDAKCQAHVAGKSIAMTMRLADESTRFAADHATYRYLAAKTGKLDAIAARANTLVRSGQLTVQQANSIAGTRAAILSEMNLAKSEADKRKDIPALDVNAIAGSNLQLKRATRNLQAIDREIRTIEAFDVSVQAGYRYADGDTTVIEDDDYYAKVKFGVRLGALSSRRKYHEDQAEAARIAALDEQNGGQLWQTEFAAGSIAKSLAGLRAAQNNLSAAYAKATDSASKLKSSDRPELVFAAFQSEMEAIRISGRLAGVRASIREMENNQRRLSALAR